MIAFQVYMLCILVITANRMYRDRADSKENEEETHPLLSTAFEAYST